MDRELRAGIVALLKAGHDTHEIAGLLGCGAGTVGGVRRAEQLCPSPKQATQLLAGDRSAARAQEVLDARGLPSARFPYAHGVADEIRMMLAADYPTSQIAKECRVPPQTVRLVRAWAGTALGFHRDDSTLLDATPWKLAPADVAEQLEAIAASFPDCQQAGAAAVRRAVECLRELVRAKALPEPFQTELRAAVREWETRSLLDDDLDRRLAELSLRFTRHAAARSGEIGRAPRSGGETPTRPDQGQSPTSPASRRSA